MPPLRGGGNQRRCPRLPFGVGVTKGGLLPPIQGRWRGVAEAEGFSPYIKLSAAQNFCGRLTELVLYKTLQKAYNLNVG